jgi:hypothetical protein
MDKKVLIFSFFLMASAMIYAQKEHVENLPSFDKRK